MTPREAIRAIVLRELAGMVPAPLAGIIAERIAVKCYDELALAIRGPESVSATAEVVVVEGFEREPK